MLAVTQTKRKVIDYANQLGKKQISLIARGGLLFCDDQPVP